MDSKEAYERSKYLKESDQKSIESACDLFKSICLSKVNDYIKSQCDKGYYSCYWNYKSIHQLVMYKNSCYLPLYGNISSKKCDILYNKLHECFKNEVVDELKRKNFYIFVSNYTENCKISWEMNY